MTTLSWPRHRLSSRGVRTATWVVSDVPMAELHLNQHIDLHDHAPTQTMWGVPESDIDADEMVRAILASRQKVYNELTHADAA